MIRHGYVWIVVILIAAVYAPLSLIYPPTLVSAEVDHLVINEVYYHSNDWENSIFIEIINPSGKMIDLGGWFIETEYYGQKWQFPATFSLNPTEMVIIFPDVTDSGDFSPSDCHGAYVLETSVTGTDQDNENYPNLIYHAGIGDLHFNITGDYILLKNETGYLMDVFVWGSSNYPEHISAPIVSSVGHSMERNWVSPPTDTDNCTQDFTEFPNAHPGQFAGTLVQTLPKQAPFAVFFAILAVIFLGLLNKRSKKKKRKNSLN